MWTNPQEFMKSIIFTEKILILNPQILFIFVQWCGKFFRSFLLVLKKLSFLEVYWAQGYKSTKLWDFPDIS